MKSQSLSKLKEFIYRAQSLGKSESEIKSGLIDNGWSESFVDEAFKTLSEVDFPTPDFGSGLSADVNTQYTQKNIHTQKSSTFKRSFQIWDSFIHILMFISLYTLVGALLYLGNSYIDYFLPNIQNAYMRSYLLGPIKYAMATLIVAYPLFAFLFTYVVNKTKEYPELKFLTVRRFLIYFTLVVSFITILVDSISLIYSFLDGSTTLNFVLKSGNFLLIAGIAFTYFFNQVKIDRKLVLEENND